MAQAFIAAGSNIEPEKNIKKAAQLLSQQVRITGISTVYRTLPVGRPQQPSYYNCVFKVETEIPPGNLKYKVLRAIEFTLGRRRTPDKYAPRTIDLDLIIYNGLAEKVGRSVLSDPQITSRPFLAFPLLELEPKLVLPGTNVAIADICSSMSKENIRPLEGYTKQLWSKFLSKGNHQISL